MKASTCLLLGTLSLLLGVSACTRQDETYTQLLNDNRYQLDHTTKNASVYFTSNKVVLSDDELESLSEALQPPHTNGKTSVHVTLPKKTSGRVGRRLVHLRKTLLKLGLRPSQIHESSSLKPEGGTIPLVLDIYRAIPTACLRNTGLAIENFGCSTAKNLILMVDDPFTLFQGTPAASNDPSREALGINNYLAGGGGVAGDSSGGGGGGSAGGGEQSGASGSSMMSNVSAVAGGGSSGGGGGSSSSGGNSGGTY
ncbi:MAG: CpaD family pilus assembly lipoprotein [Alphaproteobacteria bacterium]